MLAAALRSGSNASGSANTRGSRFAAVQLTCNLSPALIGQPPTSVSVVATRRLDMNGSSIRSTSSIADAQRRVRSGAPLVLAGRPARQPLHEYADTQGDRTEI